MISGKIASQVKRVRKVPPNVQRVLFVKSGGRCEFMGCNRDLFRHALTKAEGNFADIAHIVAFSPSGPRGSYPARPKDVHEPQNLMLLCRECHKLVDDHPERYPVSALKEYKRCHEKRIHHVTSLGPDMATAIVQLKARIAGQAVDIPVAHVTTAIAPRYPIEIPGTVIDLTHINDGDDSAYYKVATQEIRRKIERIYEPGSDVEKANHISLFALAPIPLLIYLGSLLSNKIAVDPFQRHRNPEGWAWKRKGPPVEYTFRLRKRGGNNKRVALVLSLSGPVDFETLPSSVQTDFNVYEITLGNRTPSPNFLKKREDLDRFRDVYRESLDKIHVDHGALSEIHLFPAIPAPIAILCGRELQPKADPHLIVYDYDRAKGERYQTLKIGRRKS